MRVLITGATGFLGDYVVSEFADNGYEVTAMGRNEAKLQRLVGPKVTPLQASLADLNSLSLAVDVVVHAAALSTIWGPWQDFYHTNVGGHSVRCGVLSAQWCAPPHVHFFPQCLLGSGRSAEHQGA